MKKLTRNVFFSKEDKGYIATYKEIPSISTFGETKEEAIKELKIINIQSILNKTV